MQRQAARQNRSMCPVICLRGIFYRRGVPVPRFELVDSQCGVESDEDGHSGHYCFDGAAIQILGLKSAHGEIVGDLAAKGASLKGGVIAGEQIPL